ncbi:MAG: hypothetical protein L0212_11550 [Acidobacteria bacterium]|nr:hypothetical protein [Acidobacteriota bacterium]
MRDRATLQLFESFREYFTLKGEPLEHAEELAAIAAEPHLVEQDVSSAELREIVESFRRELGEAGVEVEESAQGPSKRGDGGEKQAAQRQRAYMEWVRKQVRR